MACSLLAGKKQNTENVWFRVQLALTRKGRLAESEKCLVSHDVSPLTDYPDIAEKTLRMRSTKNIHTKDSICDRFLTLVLKLLERRN
jgi:hypothetical protein